MLAYKATDSNMCCRGFQYSFNEVFKFNGTPRLCIQGFHACPNPKDILTYYPLPTSRFFIVNLGGTIIKGEDKYVATEIEFLRELSLDELEREINNYNRNRYDYGSLNLDNITITTDDNSFARFNNAIATRRRSKATSTDALGTSITFGYESIAEALKSNSIAITQGTNSHAIVNRPFSVAMTTNYCSVAEVSSKAAGSLAISIGDSSAVISGPIDSWFLLKEYGGSSFYKLFQVDGITVKPRTKYILLNHELKEVNE